jgi:hypothetical protein
MHIEKEVARMERMAIGELKARFAELSGYLPGTRNRIWLIRRIAWKLQANAEGGLSERALARARELAQNADLRTTVPRPKPIPACVATKVTKVAFDTDSRLPVPGSVISRKYKGRTLKVVVRDDGFEFEGERFKSLSAVAKNITGSHCNGYLFFGLKGGA